MTNQIWRSPLVSLVVSGLLSGVAACTSSESPRTVDPCAAATDHAFVAAGAADLGLGADFTAVVTGQSASVVPGAQGLHMFIVNVRVRDLDVGPGTSGGGVNASARDPSGRALAMDYGCRIREFMPHADGWLYATSAYFLPLYIDALAQIDGEMVTLQVDVRDDQGHEATDMRTVVAQLIP